MNEFQAKCRGVKNSGCRITDDDEEMAFFKACLLYLMVARLMQASK